MRRIGYILTAPGHDDHSMFAPWMERFGCDRIYRETLPVNTRQRPVWKEVLHGLEPGDTLVIPRLSNALSGMTQLMYAIELVRFGGIRLVSILDRIDTMDEVFPAPSTMDFLLAVSGMSHELSRAREEARRKGLLAMDHMAMGMHGRGQRDETVVGMYLNGYGIGDIMGIAGLRSRSSVFRILKAHGVKPNRDARDAQTGPGKERVVETGPMEPTG